MNTEMELQSVRERVSKLEAQLSFLYRHLNVTYVPGANYELDPADREVAEHLKKGDMMKAVMTYRQVHKVGLDEAKAAVYDIKAGLGY